MTQPRMQAPYRGKNTAREFDWRVLDFHWICNRKSPSFQKFGCQLSPTALSTPRATVRRVPAFITARRRRLAAPQVLAHNSLPRAQNRGSRKSDAQMTTLQSPTRATSVLSPRSLSLATFAVSSPKIPSTPAPPRPVEIFFCHLFAYNHSYFNSLHFFMLMNQ
jgi:hypothetical protein